MLEKLKKGWQNFVTFLKSRHVLGTTLDDILIKLCYFGILILVILWLLPSERPFEYSNLTVGSISRQEIIAPFTFPILKTQEELEKERHQAWLSVPRVFTIDPDVGVRQIIKLEQFFKDLEQFFKSYAPSTRTAEQETTFTAQIADSLTQEFATRYNLPLDGKALGQLYWIYKEKKLRNYRDHLIRGLREVYQLGIVDVPEKEIPEGKITIANNGIEEIRSLKEVFDVQEAGTYLFNYLKNNYAPNAAEVEVTNIILNGFLRANLIYNKAETEKRKNKAVHDVPPTNGFVYENQRIVDSHEIITEDIYRKLQSLATALKERASMRSGLERFEFLTGKLLFAFAVLFLAIIYLYFYRRSIFENNKLLGMITIIYLLQLGFTALILNGLNWPALAVPIILAPTLLSMLLDAGIAFISTISLAFVIGAINSNDYSLTLMAVLVGTIALYSVVKIRNRGQMFRAMLYISIAYLVVELFMGFIHFEPLKTIFTNYAFYLLPNAILAPTAVFLLIGIFEKLFDVTTDITLLELSDLNHPLLKELSVKAPGTFHHSIIVGNLAEAAAEAIGVNSLLARVGCYYHDIGKMLKPEYFVENQMGAMNKHENLSPTMSCLIVVNHVKAGMELADKHNLPRAVKQFIPEHHGTSIISYFYHKAQEIMDPAEINENDFRYPGPKPQSKETAIAMLADTVEAASRTLQNPTPQRIKSLIDTLVENKIEEGQLDECDITMREIKMIKEAFVPILTGIHHPRIEYPSTEEKKPEAQKAEEKVANPGESDNKKAESTKEELTETKQTRVKNGKSG